MNRNLAEIILLDAGLVLAPVAANASPPYPMINVTASPYNAVGDALMGLTDCSLPNATTLTCTSETFSPADEGKVVVIDDAGCQWGALLSLICLTASPARPTWSPWSRARPPPSVWCMSVV